MKITVILAGTNEPSNAETLAKAFVEGITRQEPHAEIAWLTLHDLPLEHFTLAYYEDSTDQGENFRKIRTSIESADGLVIASPVWNFSVPAHLKNMIDRIGYFALDKTRSVGTLKGKPVYFVYTGGSPNPAWKGLQKRTVSHMPVSMRFFGASVIGSHYEGRATAGRGIFKEVLSGRPDSLQIAKGKGTEYAKVVQVVMKTGKLPFRYRFMVALFRFGGKLKRKLGL